MTDITVRLRASEIFLSREFLEKLLLATAIPIWLGVLVWSAWINLNELYVIFLIVYTALLVLLFVVRYVKRTPVVSQVGFLMFFGVPTISLLIYAIFIAFPSPSFAHTDFVRSFFIILCLLLPSGLYYQFVGSRRDSLLNSFIVILDRLGLFDYRKLFSSSAFVPSAAETTTGRPGKASYISETEFSRARRVRSYFERFEAIYGPLPSGFITGIVESTKPSVKGGELQKVSLSTDIPLSIRHMSPVILLLGLSFIGWITILPPVRASDPAIFPYIASTPSSIGFAFLGAYFFTLQFLVWRFIRKDLSSNAYVSMSVRMILSVIGVYVLGEVLDSINMKPTPSILNSIAFCVGAFPMIVWQMLSGFAKRYSRIGLVLPTMTRGIPLAELDGMTIWQETRLQDEDIENVVNFTSADVIDLFLNTRFAPNRIIDWIDQAILLSIISGSDANGESLLKRSLYALGLRSVTAIEAALNSNPSVIEGDIELSDRLRRPLASVLKTIAEIADTNPNYALVETWKGTRGTTSPSVSAPS
jgi:hypothetical protein